MKMYCKKPINVHARQLTQSELVLTAHGKIRAEAGDWVLTDPSTGDTWPVKQNFFADNYVEVEEK